MKFNRPACIGRPGFSLVEALVAISITTIAGSALLTSLGAAVRSSTDAAHVAVARGLAEQLMDEVAASRFPDLTDSRPGGLTRADFDDIDDYNGWSANPPLSQLGEPIGSEGLRIQTGGIESYSTRPTPMQPEPQFLQYFSREVQVERILPDAGSNWTVTTQHTNYRRVHVRVKYIDRNSNSITLVEIPRIFSYVPVAP